jgi:hypothetical protein
MAFIYDLSDTWNAGATTFTAIKMNVTDTASAAGSKLIDLQVGGTTRFDVDKNGQVEISAGTALLPSLSTLGDTNTGMWFPAADTIAFSEGGVEAMRIDSSANVGIGTNAPAYRLDVQSSSDSFFRVKTTGTASAWFIGEAGASGAVYYHNPSNTSSIITTNGSERMRILSTGEVGIGTSTPGSFGKLEVLGSGYTGFSVASSDASGVRVVLAANAASEARINVTSNHPLATFVNGAERMRVTAAGNVGIGTSSPNTIFEVVQNNSFIVSRSSAATGASIIIAARNDYYSGPSFASAVLQHFGASATGTSYGLSNANLSSLQFINSTNALIGTNGGAPLIFATLNVERFRITSAGNVGIGTTAPDALLSVNGVASFGDGTAAAPSITNLGDLNTGMWFPAADTVAWSTAGSERLRITSAGNLGLGTSTFGTSAATVLAIATGTAPTTGPADTIQIYSTDLSAGNTMLSLFTEGTIVNTNTTAAATHRIAIRVNGTVYYLLANTAA